MKALSIRPDYACLIFTGYKTVECRTWKTDFRGEILICSTSKLMKGTIPGHALCTVKLVDIVPFTKEHLEDACMDGMPDTPCFAWILDDLKIIKPIPVKGRLSLWNYDGPVEYFDDNIWNLPDEEDRKMFEEVWKPLFV